MWFFSIFDTLDPAASASECWDNPPAPQPSYSLFYEYQMTATISQHVQVRQTDVDKLTLQPRQAVISIPLLSRQKWDDMPPQPSSHEPYFPYYFQLYAGVYIGIWVCAHECRCLQMLEASDPLEPELTIVSYHVDARN